MLPLLLLLFTPGLRADDLTAIGFDHFYNLEFDQAVTTFQEAVRKTPMDAEPYNHLAQSLLYREMLRSGALESELVTGTNPFLRREKLKVSAEDQERFEASINKALELTTAALSRNPNDIQAIYTQGVTYGLRSNYNFLVRKAWSDALKDGTSSRKLHAQVTKLQPDNIDARLVQGAHDYVVGSLPWTYKMLGFLVGFRGDKDGGIQTLELVAQKGVKNRSDAKILLGVVYRRERQPAKAVALLKDLLAIYPRNYLLRFEMVQMYGDLGDKAKALEELKTIEALHRAGTPGFRSLPAQKVNVSRGTLLFWYRDYDVAIEELKKATAKVKDLDLNAGASAWLRMGQCYDMKKQREAAVMAYRSSVAIAPDSDPARQAKQYLSSPYRRSN